MLDKALLNNSMDISRGEMVSKLDWPTIGSAFDPHNVLNSSSLHQLRKENNFSMTSF